MNAKNILLILIVIIFCLNCTSKDPQPPVAKKIPKMLTEHGHQRVDNYYWMNERSNPEVSAYLAEENRYREQEMAHLSDLEEQLYQEMVSRIQPEDTTAPYVKNGYYYYERYEKDKEYPIYCRKQESGNGDEEILLDVNEMAEGHDYFNVRGLKVSPDNRYLAFGVDTLSRRIYTIYFKDLQSGEILDESISNAEGEMEWSNDSRNLYYTTKDSTLRPDKLFRHTLFSPVTNDSEIYHEKDNTFNIYLSKERSGKYISLLSNSTLSTEVRLIDASDISKKPIVFAEREKDLLYYVSHTEKGFYVLTNWDAKNFRVMKCSENRTSMEYWQDYIAHREDVYLEEIESFESFLTLVERKDGLIRIRIISPEKNSDDYIEFDESSYVASLSENHQFGTNWLRYNYQSLTTPSTIYDYNIQTEEVRLVKQKEIPGGFQSSDYETKRLTAPSRDGLSIPVSMVYRKDQVKEGSTNPLLLYGYGSYGSSMETWFRSDIISLLDRGFIFAIGHIRGGSELGRQWYESGKLLNKKNTFTDFIDVARYLIEENYTTRDQLCIYGGSAGGLLIGAVINTEPSLFKAAVAAVPFVDIVTTMLDESIPLTTAEYDEWGNPNIKEYYDYMLSYSPYDHVEAKSYPALFVTTGFHDSQVQYWEPAKWVAKLRAHKTDNNPLYLYTQMEAGHGGSSGRFKRYRERAMIYAFLLNEVGMIK
jgi:oligopeptidase B